MCGTFPRRCSSPCPGRRGCSGSDSRTPAGHPLWHNQTTRIKPPDTTETTETPPFRSRKRVKNSPRLCTTTPPIPSYPSYTLIVCCTSCHLMYAVIVCCTSWHLISPLVVCIVSYNLLCCICFIRGMGYLTIVSALHLVL